MEEKIRALIVEDEWITSEEIKGILEADNITVVSQEDRAEDALKLIQKEPIDVALLDISIKGKLDGIELAKQINESQKTAIIFLTAHDKDEFIERAKEVVPAAYILKPFNAKNLLITVKMAISNIHRAVVNGVMHDLTIQELNILKLISKGLDTKTISDKLSISPETVKTHRRNMLRKTGKASIPHLIADYVKQGLIN
jgi:DNA-binding NarL/FixJ family response regulator